MTDGFVPRVSVIVPIYRRALDPVIACLRRQTYRAFELVAVDDGSPEPVALPADHGLPAARLIRREPNAGANAARNAGADAARGDLVAFLDSDDLWLPEKLARQVREYDALSVGERGGMIVSCPSIVLGRRAAYVKPTPGRARLYPSAAEALFGADSLVQTSTLLMPAALARAVRFDETIATHHEPDFILRAYEAGARVLMCADALSIWDDRPRADRFTAAKVAATQAWWDGVSARVPRETWRNWRLADYVQGQRAAPVPLAQFAWRMAQEFGPAGMVKAFARLAAPGLYRAAQEARLAGAAGHALAPDQQRALDEIRRAVGHA